MGLKWQIATVYMDDIVVYSKTAEDHICDVGIVLDCIIASGLKIHESKCKWACSEVDYVGFVISRDGVKAQEDKLRAVREFPVPTTVTQVRSFLSLASYYRRFISGFSHIAGPLDALLKKGTQWHFGDAERAAFETLRDALCKEPGTLSFPDFSKPFYLYTDASNSGLGSILSQTDPDDPSGEKKPICYASRSLRGPEVGYSPTHKEALAVRWAVEKFKPYLYGRKFIIYTDHKALEHIQSVKDSTGQLFRWSLFLQDYDFEIRYRPGSNNANADALSRMPFNSTYINAILGDDLYWSLTEQPCGQQ